MNCLSDTWVCFCTIVLMTGNFVQASEDNSRDATAANNNHNGEARFGRGLQMLRLGKRSTNRDSLDLVQAVPSIRRSRSADDPDNSHLSPNDVQAVLASIFDQPRDETRRQPPLPRYGRDSSSSNINGRFLADALSDDAIIYPPDFFPLSNPRIFFRPAPRGGRYRRSFPLGRFTYGDFISQDASGRTFAFPRFGNIVDNVPHVHAKAVPRPRIGRFQNDQSDASFQSKSA
ncbi:unnamed protein product [Candidula unifasciata]|uniref:Uncharacterized protein n=1 Tax=Candidula unifasciata TaxID=100452 RepID=A0A8S3ZPN3_9EUPU|nr:unnamed protein product [Candidula unifasciata]